MLRHLSYNMALLDSLPKWGSDLSSRSDVDKYTMTQSYKRSWGIDYKIDISIVELIIINLLQLQSIAFDDHLVNRYIDDKSVWEKLLCFDSNVTYIIIFELSKKFKVQSTPHEFDLHRFEFKKRLIRILSYQKLEW